MKILAIDFSSHRRSVAAIGETSRHEVVEDNPKSTDALGMITDALAGAKLARTVVECVAIGLGPGSYTGIRAALALSQGWQLVTDVKLLGISSAETIAAQAHADGVRARIAVVIDAQRGEFYLANYDLRRERPEQTAPLRIVSSDDVKRCEVAGEVIIGPEVTRWFPNGRIAFSTASTLAILAATRTNFVSGENLEPIYLRETSFVKAPPPRII